MAKGSSAEVLTQAIIAREIGYISEEIFSRIQTECKGISSMLTKLIKARSKPFEKK
jgi:four helix bundle protein